MWWRYTVVLFACVGCHKRFTEELNGHWTLGQVRRHPPIRDGFESPWLGYRTSEKENLHDA